MTERERWIVYPLLFLALGASLRDKLVDRTVTKRIVCQELVIEDDESDGRHPPHVYAKIGRTEATATTPEMGLIYVDGKMAVHGGVIVEGVVNVDGVVNSKHYLQSLPNNTAPASQALPGRGAANAGTAPPQSDPPKAGAPADKPDSGQTPPPSKSNTPEPPAKD